MSVDFNGVQSPGGMPSMPYFYNLGTMFGWVAQKNSDRPVLILPDKTLTFKELSNLHLRIASRLVDIGLKRGDRVAIVSAKGSLTFGLMLACLRLGIAYINLDSLAPIERNISIIKASGALRVFVEDSEDSKFFETLAAGIQTLVLSLDNDFVGACDDFQVSPTDTETRVDGATVAYIMFTSGSTGVPKGVAISHQSVLHFIAWIHTRFKISVEDRFTGLNPLHFDNSVFDFFGSIFLGASLAPVRREKIEKPGELLGELESLGCTIWFSVPSLLIYLNAVKAISPYHLRNFRLIVFGGEGFPKSELKKLQLLAPAATKLINVYGPTECTCMCSSYEVQLSDFEDLNGLPPLGEINQNIDYMILDDLGEASKLGELYLIGDNVALGYLNDQERTAIAFTIIKTPDRFGKRMYRTGDIVDIRDGTLRFAGRKDNQIKHLGYRIELEEIELALSDQASVIQSAAIYVRANTDFGRIIAFVATSSNSLTEHQILEDSRKRLPSYMVPSRIFVLPNLPKNRNGKIDRLALSHSFSTGVFN